MKLAPSAAFAALLALTAAAAAQPVAPERAPPAQQAAPPDKFGPPLHEKQTPAAKIKRDETTGAAPKDLAPGKDDTSSPDTRHHDAVPSR
jgi:hypothetical protein